MYIMFVEIEYKLLISDYMSKDEYFMFIAIIRLAISIVTSSGNHFREFIVLFLICKEITIFTIINITTTFSILPRNIFSPNYNII